MTAEFSEAAALLDYVERYMDAASYIPEGGNRLQPLMQMYGQIMELALKGYLAATVGEWPQSHDLEKLLILCLDAHLDLDEHTKTNVIPNLNKAYYMKESGFWKFPSRYPRPEGSVWVTPTIKWIRHAVLVVSNQSRAILGRKPLIDQTV